MLTAFSFRGFGDRGIDGKIDAITYARESGVPFFGVGLGMQLAAVEFARDVLGIKDAHSAEFDSETENAIIENNRDFEERSDIEKTSGDMRLGAHPCKLKEGTKAQEAYNDELVYERHRHRFEFNNKYREQFENAGMIVARGSPDGQLVEIIELTGPSVLHRNSIPSRIRITSSTPDTTHPRIHSRSTQTSRLR